jgi:hypothetical protein
MPPPDTTLRRRSGYSAIDTEDLRDPTVLTDEPEGHQEDTGDDIDIDDEREVVQREGWNDLLCSFLASGAMTVRAVIILFQGKFNSYLSSSLRIFSRSSLPFQYSGST